MFRRIYLLIALAIVSVIVLILNRQASMEADESVVVSNEVKANTETNKVVPIEKDADDFHLTNQAKNSVSFESIRNLWKQQMPLTEMEHHLFSRMPVKHFIEMYSDEAENGNQSARFFIAYLKNVCASAAIAKDGSSTNNNPNYYLLLDMSSQCDSLFSLSEPQSQLSNLHSSKYDSQLQYLLRQEEISFSSFEVDNINGIPNDRDKIYKGLLSQGEPDANIAFYEGMTRIDGAASLNSFVEVLSTTSMTRNPAERAEIAAWVVTSCASGYPCDYSQFTMNSLLQFCEHDSLECKGKSLKQIVEEYVPGSSYEDILSRSMEISGYIANGEGTALLETYLQATKE